MKYIIYSVLIGLVCMLFVAGVFGPAGGSDARTIYLGSVQVLATLIAVILFNCKL